METANDDSPFHVSGNRNFQYEIKSDPFCILGILDAVIIILEFEYIRDKKESLNIKQTYYKPNQKYYATDPYIYLLNKLISIRDHIIFLSDKEQKKITYNNIFCTIQDKMSFIPLREIVLNSPYMLNVHDMKAVYKYLSKEDTDTNPENFSKKNIVSVTLIDEIHYIFFKYITEPSIHYQNLQKLYNSRKLTKSLIEPLKMLSPFHMLSELCNTDSKIPVKDPNYSHVYTVLGGYKQRSRKSKNLKSKQNKLRKTKLRKNKTRKSKSLKY